MNKPDQTMIYQLALSLIPRVGGVTARKLVAYCGSAEAVFREKRNMLERIPGIGQKTSMNLGGKEMLERAEKELLTMQKHQIRAAYFLDDDYPYRLKQCEDGPVILFSKGEADLNRERVVAVVGTRNISPYGKEKCEELLQELSAYNPVIVSGLAYGVDACAHREALRQRLTTSAVLGHGLDRIYPSLHKRLAGDILKEGSLLTDFLTGTRPDRENFPKRNRIIAGLCDAVIVVEAAITGGALITANIANSYNRDVFALPGRTTDTYSHGCNALIKSNRAHLFENAGDIAYIMGWEEAGSHKPARQTALFESLTEAETKVAAALKKQEAGSMDQLVRQTGLNLGMVSKALLDMECRGLLTVLPGKMYRLHSSLHNF